MWSRSDLSGSAIPLHAQLWSLDRGEGHAERLRSAVLDRLVLPLDEPVQVEAPVLVDDEHLGDAPVGIERQLLVALVPRRPHLYHQLCRGDAVVNVLVGTGVDL